MFSRNLILILLSAVVVLFNSCRKYETLVETDIVYYGHKGGGSNIYNENFMENTIPSFEEALEFLDGVEFDIQLSADGTIWIYHNHNLNDKSCIPANAPKYIPLMKDEEIEATFLCEFGKKDRIYRFSEVVELWNNRSRSFPMTIDIKISYPNSVIEEFGGRSAYYERLAKAVADNVKSPVNTEKISFEFLSTVFLDELKKYEATKNMVLFYSGDGGMEEHIDKAIAGGYDGISLGYQNVTKESIVKANNKGLLVQIWTVYYIDELKATYELSPDFIHTDNIYSKNILRVK